MTLSPSVQESFCHEICRYWIVSVIFQLPCRSWLCHCYLSTCCMDRYSLLFFLFVECSSNFPRILELFRCLCWVLFTGTSSWLWPVYSEHPQNLKIALYKSLRKFECLIFIHQLWKTPWSHMRPQNSELAICSRLFDEVCYS